MEVQFTQPDGVEPGEPSSSRSLGGLRRPNPTRRGSVELAAAHQEWAVGIRWGAIHSTLTLSQPPFIRSFVTWTVVPRS